MDLNGNVLLFPCTGELTKNNHVDTTLRLDCFGYGGSISAGFGSARTNPEDKHIPSIAPDDGCRLVLGLGPPPTTYYDDNYPFWAEKSSELESRLHLGSSSVGDSIIELGLPAIFESSGSTLSSLNPPNHPNQIPVIPIVDMGSSSAKRSGDYMPSLALAPNRDSGKTIFHTQELLEPSVKSQCNPSQLSSKPSAASDYSINTISERASRISNSNKCKFQGCLKGARGATGFCIGHGGRQSCQKPGCYKDAESQTVYCKAHGGGYRCQYLGCTKSAEGTTDLCTAHVGGRRCGYPAGCSRAARGKSLCFTHGGGKRSSCQFPDCKKDARGDTMFCKAHGGGKRCVVAGCMKGACGRTNYCARHGGGKRCKFPNFGKSAQGKTEYYKAHPEGRKRCNWGGAFKCWNFGRGKDGLCADHSSMVQWRETNEGRMIGRRLLHGIVSGAPSTFGENCSSASESVVSDSIDSVETETDVSGDSRGHGPPVPLSGQNRHFG